MSFLSRIKQILFKKEEKVSAELPKEEETEVKSVSTTETETKSISINEIETKPVSINETETRTLGDINTKLDDIKTLLKEDLEKQPLLTELKGLYLLVEKHGRRIANLITELAIARNVTPKEIRKEILAVINQAREQGKNTKEIVEEIVSKGLCSRATAYRIVKSISTIETEIEPVSIKENENKES